MKKFISKYSQQLILALLIIAVTAGVGFAGFQVPGISSGFLRDKKDGVGLFVYGYGFGYLNNVFQKGWGYGYDRVDRAKNYGYGPDYSDYGFFQGHGAPVVTTQIITQTSNTIGYSTDYLSRVNYSYALSYPIDKQNVIDHGDEANYSSGVRAAALTKLTCDTRYYVDLTAIDAGGQTWTTTFNFTTDKCSSGSSTGTAATTSTNSVGSHATGKPFGTPSSDAVTQGQFPESPKLYYGDFGPGPKKIQLLLNKLGFKLGTTGAGSPGHETSFFGPKTKAALKKFQAAHGLNPDGVYGPLVQAAMLAELNK